MDPGVFNRNNNGNNDEGSGEPSAKRSRLTPSALRAVGKKQFIVKHLLGQMEALCSLIEDRSIRVLSEGKDKLQKLLHEFNILKQSLINRHSLWKQQKQRLEQGIREAHQVLKELQEIAHSQNPNEVSLLLSNLLMPDYSWMDSIIRNLNPTQETMAHWINLRRDITRWNNSVTCASALQSAAINTPYSNNIIARPESGDGYLQLSQYPNPASSSNSTSPSIFSVLRESPTSLQTSTLSSMSAPVQLQAPSIRSLPASSSFVQTMNQPYTAPSPQTNGGHLVNLLQGRPLNRSPQMSTHHYVPQTSTSHNLVGNLQTQHEQEHARRLQQRQHLAQLFPLNNSINVVRQRILPQQQQLRPPMNQVGPNPENHIVHQPINPNLRPPPPSYQIQTNNMHQQPATNQIQATQQADPNINFTTILLPPRSCTSSRNNSTESEKEISNNCESESEDCCVVEEQDPLADATPSNDEIISNLPQAQVNNEKDIRILTTARERGKCCEAFQAETTEVISLGNESPASTIPLENSITPPTSEGSDQEQQPCCAGRDCHISNRSRDRYTLPLNSTTSSSSNNNSAAVSTFSQADKSYSTHTRVSNVQSKGSSISYTVNDLINRTVLQQFDSVSSELAENRNHPATVATSRRKSTNSDTSSQSSSSQNYTVSHSSHQQTSPRLNTDTEIMARPERLSRRNSLEVPASPKCIEAFDELNFDLKLLSGLNDIGIKIPTPGQKQGLTSFLQRKDIVLESPEGSGKTTMALIGLLQQLSNPPSRVTDNSSQASYVLPEAIIFTPSTQLAQETKTTFNKFASFLPSHPQSNANFKAVCVSDSGYDTGHILLGTPSSIKAFVEAQINLAKHLKDTRNVRCVVVDNAEKLSGDDFSSIIGIIYSLPCGSAQVVVLARSMNVNGMHYFKNKAMRIPQVISISTSEVTSWRTSDKMDTSNSRHSSSEVSIPEPSELFNELSSPASPPVLSIPEPLDSYSPSLKLTHEFSLSTLTPPSSVVSGQDVSNSPTDSVPPVKLSIGDISNMLNPIMPEVVETDKIDDVEEPAQTTPPPDFNQFKQFYFEDSNDDMKVETVVELSGTMMIGQAYIFCDKSKCEWLGLQLKDNEDFVCEIYDESRNEDELLALFESGAIRALIMSDDHLSIAGHRLKKVPFILNYDFPPNEQVYLKRSSLGNHCELTSCDADASNNEISTPSKTNVIIFNFVKNTEELDLIKEIEMKYNVEIGEI